MKHSYAFVEVPNEEGDTTIRVDVAATCGQRFEGIATISDPYSANPALACPRPLGFNGLNEIMRNWLSCPAYLSVNPPGRNPGSG